MRFTDKVAFITGGAVGFGRAFAQALAEEGAAVVIADVDLAAAEQAVKELAEQGHRSLASAATSLTSTRSTRLSP